MEYKTLVNPSDKELNEAFAEVVLKYELVDGKFKHPLVTDFFHTPIYCDPYFVNALDNVCAELHKFKLVTISKKNNLWFVWVEQHCGVDNNLSRAIIIAMLKVHGVKVYSANEI